MRFLITGGAGFIGSNLADALLAEREDVTIFDNLSRPGSHHNLGWLRSRYGQRLTLVQGDIRDSVALPAIVRDADVVVHLAGQVAVTTSIVAPREDFEINALGTLNVLEAVRNAAIPPILLFASTNKVYGGMEGVAIAETATRHRYRDMEGISEEQGLDFHSPYGCSKGAADQYVRDYARIYGLRTVVMRQSCIYGPRQFGVEDQGWLAHFVIAAQLGRPISIYGDGKQVRDMLHVHDLIRAYRLAVARIEAVKGQVFNIGGGPANTRSIWREVGPELEQLAGRPLDVRFSAARAGDQLVCVMDTGKAAQLLGWEPLIDVSRGVALLWDWVRENRTLFQVAQ
jgi:CDP-paratose 2-epimerase